jgi:hypothetical protein
VFRSRASAAHGDRGGEKCAVVELEPSCRDLGRNVANVKGFGRWPTAAVRQALRPSAELVSLDETTLSFDPLSRASGESTGSLHVISGSVSRNFGAAVYRSPGSATTFGDVADVKRDHRMSPSVGLALSFRLRAGHYSLSKHASSVVTSRCRSLVRPLVETSSPAAALLASA